MKIMKRLEGVTTSEPTQEEYAEEMDALAAGLRSGRLKIKESSMDVPARRLLLIFEDMDKS